MDGNGPDRKFVAGRGRVLMEAGLWNSDEPKQNREYSSELSARDREVLDTVKILGECLR